MVIIGLAGKAFSGKDTFAEILKEYQRSWGIRIESYALAKPLKDAAKVLFGFTDEQVNTAEGKETVDPLWGKTPRYYMQDLGTEVCRERYDDQFWIKRARAHLETIKDADVVIITDVRFPNEADWIRGMGGTIVHITRPGISPVRQHVSEEPLPSKHGDLHITNNGGLEDYHSWIVMGFMNYFFSKVREEQAMKANV